MTEQQASGPWGPPGPFPAPPGGDVPADPFAPPGTAGPVSPPVATGPGGPAGPGPGGPGPTGGRDGRRGRAGRKGRPTFGAVVVFAIVFRVGRDVVERIVASRWGFLGVIAVALAFILIVVAWRAFERRRIRTRGGVEFTPELVTKQIAESELGPPAFPEDGTVLGASLLVVNQNSKIVEINTTYEVFGSNGARLGTVRQIGQSRAKMVARIVTSLDQFFTHHFEVLDLAGRPVLRMTRPRKIFLTKLHVFAGDNRYIGTIRQENVFWKIRFSLQDEIGRVVGQLRAENVRAWDFHVYDAHGRNIATMAKTWEGWSRTAFTRADRYVVRVHQMLPYPLRELAITAALATDLALKQDTRGFT
jgi:hypothetical protein